MLRNMKHIVQLLESCYMATPHQILSSSLCIMFTPSISRFVHCAHDFYDEFGNNLSGEILALRPLLGLVLNFLLDVIRHVM